MNVDLTGGVIGLTPPWYSRIVDMFRLRGVPQGHDTMPPKDKPMTPPEKQDELTGYLFRHGFLSDSLSQWEEFYGMTMKPSEEWKKRYYPKDHVMVVKVKSPEQITPEHRREQRACHETGAIYLIVWPNQRAMDLKLQKHMEVY